MPRKSEDEALYDVILSILLYAAPVWKDFTKVKTRLKELRSI